MATPSVVRSTAAVRSSWRGIGAAGVAPPPVELARRHDVGRHALVVEVVHLVVVEQVAASHAILQRAHLASKLLVVAEERVRGVPLAVDEGVAHEQLAGERRVDPVEPDGAPGHDRQAVQRDRLGDDGAPTARPSARSPYDRFTRWAPMRSAHSGWTAATRRAHRRSVSTSSPAITHRGGCLASTEPGAITNPAAGPRNVTGPRRVRVGGRRARRGATAGRPAPPDGRGRGGRRRH